MASSLHGSGRRPLFLFGLAAILIVLLIVLLNNASPGGPSSARNLALGRPPAPKALLMTDQDDAGGKEEEEGEEGEKGDLAGKGGGGVGESDDGFEEKQPFYSPEDRPAEDPDEQQQHLIVTTTTTHDTTTTSTTTTSSQQQQAPPPAAAPSSTPSSNILSNFPTTFELSPDFFVRAAYFDDRPRDGHRNATVFLVVCLRAITDEKRISGCAVDGRPARNFSVKLIGETPLWRAFYDYINHEEVLVHCYDLPARNGSVGHVAYRRSRKTGVADSADSAADVVWAISERSVAVPAPRIVPTSPGGRRYNMTIVTCAKIFEHPPWLEKWLTYQQTLGVDHVHLDAEDSFEANGGLRNPLVARMMQEGFLSVDIWKKYLSPSEIWYHNQGLIYEDCPYRFRGTYDYIVMLDTDDFFTPRVPSEKKLHYYIATYCRGADVGSCKFRWVEYYPDAVGLDASISTEDGNVTRALKSFSHYMQGNPKSLHRTTVLIDTATHYAYRMMPGYAIVPVPVGVAYVAHVRKYKPSLPKPGEGLVEGLPNGGVCPEHRLSKLLLLAMTILFAFVVSR